MKPTLGRPCALFVLVAVACVLGGCRSGTVQGSGLLGNRRPFQRRDADTLVDMRASPEDFERFDRIRLEPVLLFLEPGVSEGISPSNQRKLTQMFSRSLATELQKSFELAQDPRMQSVDVMVLRAAITDVRVGSMGGDGTADLGSATLEIELLDGKSGERLLALIVRTRGTQYQSTTEGRLAEAQRVFDTWAAGAREWLEEATGQ